MLRALAHKFTREGFLVFDAKGGKEGIEIGLKEHPDIVLLDILMPKPDGMKVLETIRRDKEWGHKAPVIILTNLSDGDKARVAKSQGVADYMIKTDWRLEDVVNVVRERLAHNS